MKIFYTFAVAAVACAAMAVDLSPNTGKVGVTAAEAGSPSRTRASKSGTAARERSYRRQVYMNRRRATGMHGRRERGAPPPQVIIRRCKRGEISNPEACAAARAAASRGVYHGEVAETTEPMACVDAVSARPTEVVILAGDIRTGKTEVIATFRPKIAGEKWRRFRDTNWGVRTHCFPRSAVTDVMSICNGTKGRDGKASVLRPRETATLRKKGRIGKPVSLLGKRR